MAKIISLDNNSSNDDDGEEGEIGLDNEAKAKIAILAAQSDKDLMDGSDETLQLLAVYSIALEQFKCTDRRM